MRTKNSIAQVRQRFDNKNLTSALSPQDNTERRTEQ